VKGVHYFRNIFVDENRTVSSLVGNKFGVENSTVSSDVRLNRTIGNANALS
jgi:hypothetical protein